ncbi:phospholipase D family nuclease [Wolbachia endosymbiont of Dirofilaria (Dirofilaria) immitis]|uniref:phospholipase D family nuclease n=1 Tax=Wolbachia endosymbiont of Dirofilaria (Dirofilaria) immitis TaxID=1812115 RepID=UPI00158E4123|nr:phospholipase D family protein [Wolbachia endosymbiont of Dirofilaria (Dirofilaria) immitis]QKX02211.1 phospholipase D family protein [Wolbachia endosymbiont of Dirofilaria (Dirofilaria) immitis]
MRLLYLLFLLACSSPYYYTGHTDSIFSPCPRATVCFSPEEDCTKSLISEIDQSKESILVQEYTFTLKAVAYALIKAKKRGIDVKVILDKSQLHSKYSVINELFASKIPIWIDDKPKIAHNKIIIIDNQRVITGSFNLSRTARKGNAENLLIIKNYPELIKQYVKNWETRKSQSYKYIS